MGLIETLFGFVFGSGRNVVRETAEVFRPNAEASAQREHEAVGAALMQHAAEFRDQRSGFDRLMDGLNRLPRPAMALGSIGLFVAAMTDPVWFSERMQGLALVPEALWWLLGAVVSFYFGARHQAKGQEFQRQIAHTMAQAPQVAQNIRTLRSLRDEEGAPQAQVGDALPAAAPLANADRNPALDEWKRAG